MLLGILKAEISQLINEYDEPLQLKIDLLEEQIESLQEGDTYWRHRAELAEEFIHQSPCDPDHTVLQIHAYNAWQECVKRGESF